MENSRNRDRLSLILAPSPSLSAASHMRSRTVSPDSVQSTTKRVHGRGKLRARRDRYPPLIVHSRTPSKSESPVPQPPWERPPSAGNHSVLHRPPSRHESPLKRENRASWGPSVVEPAFPPPSSTGRSSNEGTNRRVQLAEHPRSGRPPGNSFLPIPLSSPIVQRTPRAARRLSPPPSVDVAPILDRITLEPKQVTVSRSHSWRAHKRGRPTIGDDIPEEETGLSRVHSLPEPLAEKQRIMNVRRARKMQQVFGSEPPQALYQVTHVPPISEVERDPTEAFDKRGSVSTILSLSSVNFPSSSPLSFGQRRFSASSAGMGSTPPMTPVLQQPETSEPLFPAFDFAHTAPLTLSTFPHISPVDTRKTGIQHTVATNSETSKGVSRAETTGRRRENNFRQRRIRAAKLSKFFGVGYQDLEPHLDPETKRNDLRKVEVAIDDGRGLPWDRRELRSLEMEDVIVRLRDLRSS